MNHQHRRHPPPLPLPLRKRLGALIDRDGERVTLARLHIGRPALARAIAGLPIRAGTTALIEQALDRIDSAQRIFEGEEES